MVEPYIVVNLICYIFCFIVGCTIGSFLNVCIYRIPLKLSPSKGRSFCPSCGNTLSWKELFPVFSFIFLRGRCRHCKAPISIRYPIIEIAGGLCALAAFFTFGLSLKTIGCALFLWTLLTAAMIDADTGEIPDRIHIAVIISAILFVPFQPLIPWWEHLIGIGVLSVPLLICALFFNGFGGGDIKLCAVCGGLMGWKLALLGGGAAIIAGGIWGCVLLLTKRADRKSTISFGPFLSAGFALAICFGQPIIEWYINLWAF